MTLQEVWSLLNLYNSSFSGEQIDEAIGVILNGGISAAVDAAQASAEAAAKSASEAAGSAASVGAAATNAQSAASRASGSATEAESYAHGGTGTREGEDTDNARYYSEEAAAAAAAAAGSADSVAEDSAAAVAAASAATAAAQNAGNSAVAAADSAAAAEAAANSIAGSVDAAAGSATAAKQSETNAKDSETAAKEAQEAAEAAKDAAEDAAQTLNSAQINAAGHLILTAPDGSTRDLGDVTGEDGSSIESITRTAGNGAPGTTDTYTVTLTDGSKTQFQVYNGKDGTGSGDMTAAVYDPQGKAQDIFKYVDEAKVVVDSAFSTTSTNPVQNKVISAKFDSLARRMSNRGYNGTTTPTIYYEIGRMVVDDGSNYGSILFTGRLGYWTTSGIASFIILLANRDGVKASVFAQGNIGSAFNYCDIEVYRQEDKSDIIYLKTNSYWVFDLEYVAYQHTVQYKNVAVTPTGGLVWTLSKAPRVSTGFDGIMTVADMSVDNVKFSELVARLATVENADYATTAELDAAIAAIPPPNVSGQIGAHNADTTAHADIREELVSKAPAYTYGTDDLEAGVSPLETGKLYFVYE